MRIEKLLIMGTQVIEAALEVFIIWFFGHFL